MTLTHDERYLVSSEESASSLAVLTTDSIVGNVERDAVIGIIPVDRAPISVVLAPGSPHLFATTQSSIADGDRRGPGRIAVVDTRAFGQRVGWGQTIPDALVAQVEVGNAVRLALSHGGQVAWVTLRAEGRLLALDAPALIEGRRVELASVGTGPAPVGVALRDNDRYVVVANSNRFDNTTGSNQTVSVIDTALALASQPSVVETITVGVFPRELVPGARGEIFLTNFESDTVTVLA